jgi:hypothetical protein
MQQVIIDIEGGTPKITVKCVSGADCKKLTKELESKLGTVQESKPTREMYERAKQTTKASY